jgi:rubrerythrin
MSKPLVFNCPVCSTALVGVADAPTKCPNCGRVFVNGVEVKEAVPKATEP